MVTSVEKVEARAVIRFLHLQGKSAREIPNQMTDVYQKVYHHTTQRSSGRGAVIVDRQTLKMNPEVEDHLSLRNRGLWHRWKL
jgi:hypothetical protein